MAIPQPGFVGTRDSYRQGLNQGAANRTQSVGVMANTVQQKRQLEEQQRQFDIGNQIKHEQQIVEAQYGGDWSRWFRGREQEDGSWAGNPRAEILMKSIYGDDQGSALYQDAVNNMDQTKEQMLEETLNYYMRIGGPQEGAPGGQQVAPDAQARTASQQTPAGNAQPAGGTVSRPFDTNIPGSAGNIPGVASGGPQRTDVGYMPSAGAAPPQGVRYPDWKRDTVPTSGYTGQSPAEVPPGQMARADAFNTAQEEARLSGALASSTPSQAGAAQKLTNAKGIPAGETQVNADVPLNTETISPLFGKIKLDKNASATDIATALEGAVSSIGTPEAAAFMKSGTGYLRKPDATDEQWNEFDQKSQEYFGVDGATLFGIRNQIFDNIANGRPADYMPPENERKQWWWTGEDMPVYAKLREYSNIPEPSVAESKIVADGIANMDVASLEAKDLKNLDGYLTSAQAMVVANVVDNPEAAASVSKALGLGSNATKPVQEAFDHMRTPIKIVPTGTEYGVGFAVEGMSGRASAVMNRMFSSAQRTTQKVGRALSGNSDKEAAKAEEKRDNGEPITFRDTLALSASRREQIYREMAGDSPMSVEVRMSIPIEERRFDEAIKQFDDQLGISKRQMTESEKMGEANRVVLGANAAILKLQADMLQAELTAMENATPEVTENDHIFKIYNAATQEVNDFDKQLMEWAAGDMEKFVALKSQALANVPSYKAANEMKTYVEAQATGLGIKETELAVEYYKKRMFNLSVLFGDKKVDSGETTRTYGVDVFGGGSTQTPSAVKPPASTVNSGGSAGQTPAEIELAKQLGY